MIVSATDFLRGKTAVATHHRTWEWHTTPLPLQENIYLSPTLPPDELISSARVGILRRGGEVMVIHDHQNQPYIIPGGRREPAKQSWKRCTGKVVKKRVGQCENRPSSAFTTSNILRPSQMATPTRIPHFFWAIFTAQANQYDPTRLETDFYVTSAQFHPIHDVLTWQLGYGQHELLQTAVKISAD